MTRSHNNHNFSVDSLATRFITTITMTTLDEQLLKVSEDGKLHEAKRLIQDSANVNYKNEDAAQPKDHIFLSPPVPATLLGIFPGTNIMYRYPNPLLEDREVQRLAIQDLESNVQLGAAQSMTSSSLQHVNESSTSNNNNSDRKSIVYADW
jgi:hypothetical protein